MGTLPHFSSASFLAPFRSLFPSSWLTGQDPWVIQYKNSYVLIQSVLEGTALSLRQFDSLSQMTRSKEVIIWKPDALSDHSQLLWAPELHSFPDLSDTWYIYYAASDGNNDTHRMYVLESETSNPFGPYHEKGKLYDPRHDHWAIDGTVFVYNGTLYCVWSGIEDEVAKKSPIRGSDMLIAGKFPTNLYIAAMSNPWTIESERVCIARPEFGWETTVAAINEAPELIEHNGKLFLVYSANASWSPDYELGLLAFTGGNILEASSWIKYPTPVFKEGATTVYGPGHASFITHGRDTVMVYHAKKSSASGWEREIRYQKFTWSADGLPVFGEPV